MKQAILFLTAWTLWGAAAAHGQTCSGVQTFTFPTGTISDGSGAENYSDGLNCGFLIQSPGASAYTLTFTGFALQNGPDKLIVYRGASPAAEVHAVLTGASLPGPMTVEASSVYLRFITDGAVNDAGWTLNYAVDSPPAGPTCAGNTLVFAASGTLNDGSGVGNYSPNLDCRWLLSPAGAKTLTLTFKEFDVRPVNDVVEIYSGDVENPANLVASYSGSALPPSVSVRGNPAQALVAFRTDGSEEAAGFTFDYFSSSGFCAGPSLLTGVSGIVTDGSGTANYANNANCSWRILPQFAPDRIRITFTEFNTQAGADFVRVYAGADATGTLLGSFSGTSVPAPIVVSGPSAFVHFTSNAVVTRPGWSFNYNLEYDPCAPPSNLQVSVSDVAAQLTWLPHDGPTAPYLLEVVGQGGYNYSIFLPVGTTEHTIFNLPAGRDYTATLTALCATGSPLVAGFETDCPAPSVPVIDEFTLTDDYIAFYWNTHPDVPNYSYELFAQGVPVQSGTVGLGFADFAYLDAGTDYVFRLYNQCFNGPSATYTESAFSTPCLAPAGLTTDVAETEAALSWNAVPGVSQYAVSITDGDEFYQSATVPSTETTWTGLVPGTFYAAAVRSICVNASESPEMGTLFATVCPPPTNAQAENVGTNSADLRWQTQWGQNDVRVRVTAGDQTFFDGAATEGELALWGLPSSTAFTVELATLCRDFDSETVVFEFVTLCPPPTDNHFYFVGEENITVYMPVSPAGTGYRFDVYSGSGLVSSATLSENPATEYVVGGLTPGESYVLRYYNVCALNASDEYVEIEFTTDCGTVTGLLATNAAATSVELVWNAANGAERYLVEVFDPNFDYVYIDEVFATSLTLTGLTIGTDYFAAVYPICPSGVYGYEAVLEFSTACEAPTGFVAQNVTVTTATLVWDEPAGAAGFQLDGEPASSGIVLTGLTGGTEYAYSLRHVCPNGSVSEAAYLTFTTAVCEEPVDMEVVDIAGNDVMITWSVVNFADEYAYTLTDDGETVAAGTTDFAPITITNLTPGVEYVFGVQATCEGENSPTSYFTFMLDCPTPGNLGATPQAYDAEITWEAADGGETYRFSLYRGDNPNPVQEFNLSETSASIEGLEPGTRYVARIETVCEDAVSAADEIEFTTACPGPEDGEVVAGVSDAAAAWNSVAGVNAFALYLNGEYRETVTETNYTLEGLHPGTNYALQVASACNDDESGALELSFQTVCPPPSDVALAEIGTGFIVFEIEPTPGVRGYRIVASAQTEGLNALQDYDVAPDNLYLLSELSPGEDYSIAIYTLCNDTESEPLEDDVSTLCIAQTGLEVGDATTTTAYAVWDNISEYGYLVTFNESVIIYEPELLLEGLLPGNSYTLSVAPVCMNGSYGTPMTVTFNTPCPTVENLVANVASHSVTLTWDDVPGAVFYVALYDWNGTLIGGLNETDENQFSYTGLTPGGPYEAEIYTYCPGSGETALDPATRVFNLSCPQIDFAQQVGLEAERVTVEFADSPDAVQYFFKLFLNGQPYGTLLTPYLPPFTFEELVPGEDYTLEIYAICPLYVESEPYVLNVSTQCPDMETTPEVYPGTDTVRVSWTPIPGLSDYDVELYDAMYNVVAQTQVSGASHHTFTGLVPGKNYLAFVAPRCTNGAGGGPTAPFMTLCPTPENLAVQAGVTTAVLTWNDYGADIYEISVFDGTITTYFVASASPYTLTGLSPETNYTANIRALCAETASNFGTPVEFSTFSCPTPENAVVFDVGATTADLEWTNSALANGGYVISLTNAMSGTSTFDAPAPPYSFSGLAPGANYTGTITALCDDVVSGTAAFAFSTQCPAPENFIASEITESSALLTWDDVPNYNGFTLVYYPVSNPASPSNELVFVNEFELSGLAPGTSYFAVLKTNCVDTQSDERTLTFTTVCPSPAIIPTGGEDFILLEISGLVGDAFGVKIETGGNTVVEQSVAVDPSGEYLFDGLAGGTSYTVTVTNFCTDTTSRVEYDVATVCGYPNGGEIVGFTATTATIAWNAVAGVGGYGLSLTSSVGAPSLDDLTDADSPYTFTDLLPGTTYEVELVTLCPNGQGDFQIIGVFTTPCPEPTNLVLVQSTATTAEFTWTGAEGVATYSLSLEPGALTLTFSGTSGVVTGLVPGTLYTATVASVCTETLSVTSNVVNFATTCPDVPTVEVTQITATSALATWTASEGAASYNLTLTNLATSTSQNFNEITETTLTLTGLEPNTGYSISVYANCLGGESSVNPATTTFETPCTDFVLFAVASDETPCLVSNTELSVELSLTDAGFDPSDFSVAWQPGDLTGVSVSVNPQTTTTYTAVAVRNGCEYTATVTLTLPALASVSDDEVCLTTGGTASIEVINAPQFRVEPENDVTINGNAVTFANEESETYIVVVTDENACEQYFVVNAWVNAPADFNLSDGQHFYACAAPFDLIGTPGGGTFSTVPEGLLTGATLDPGAAVPGEYVVTYTYTGAGGCEVGRSVTITVGGNPSAEITAIDGDGVLCSYQTGPFELLATPGGGTFTGDGVSGGFFSPDNGPGNYVISYEVVDGGCTFTSTISITYLSALGATVETTHSTGGTDGTLTAAAIGGLPPYEYSLDGTNYFADGTFENLAGGDYTVYVRDAAGCETTVGAVITVCSVPTFVMAVPNANSAVVGWTNLVASTPYSVRYRPVGTTPFQIRTNINTTSVNLTGLLSGTTYEGQILSACGAISEFFSFTTLTGGGCTTPTGMTAGYIALTTALAAWNAVDAATSYVLRWRPVGGTLYNQTIVNAPATSFLITGLAVGTTYEISVRSRCGTISTTFSAPVIYFHSPPTRQAQTSAASEMALYPNPSKGNFTLRFTSEAEPSAEITVAELTGRVVYRRTFEAASGENLIAETLSVARGVYVVTLKHGATHRSVKWVVE